ncbi:stemmadenine O-acetyltransferase-like [Euphorbia lathyris]|uniref:stemmadenine O-acetyltransferase-like n=1 Tax=Euphorbia lathyris TaxID=212925 RepID=UPI003313EFE3
MEVEIISKQTLKPSSSSTNSHPKIFKNSLLDQLIPSRYASLVLFYPNIKFQNPDVFTRLNLLKTSLSETLACLYPLAGKIRDDLSIDCNDEGACFVETRVNCSLDEFLTEPDLLSLKKFLPCEIISDESVIGTFVTNVQVNVFKCDGIAVGICLSHRIMDGDGLRMFLKMWSGNSTNKSSSEMSNFAVSGAATLFPADDLLWLRDSSNAMWGSFLKKGNFVTKRFVFYASAIANLKDKAIESGIISRPTRVEVVSAILWKSMAAASAELNGFRRASLLNHLVNLRRRMEPSLVENTLGNFLWIASAKQDEAAEPEFGDLAGKIREAIARIDNEFVEKMKGKEGKCVMLKSLEEGGEIGGENGVDYFVFSSWCNFGYYDVGDFGWGEPVWVSGVGGVGGANSMFFNVIMLVDTKCGGGVEAWVTLDEQEMAILERDDDIIRFASLDLSPLLNL